MDEMIGGYDRRLLDQAEWIIGFEDFFGPEEIAGRLDRLFALLRDWLIAPGDELALPGFGTFRVVPPAPPETPFPRVVFEAAPEWRFMPELKREVTEWSSD